MSASLVGSEMCIRDRCSLFTRSNLERCVPRNGLEIGPRSSLRGALCTVCLLYTSDAADDM
eukprot:13466012-Alexandrium_andersonii.AAC.1